MTPLERTLRLKTIFIIILLAGGLSSGQGAEEASAPTSDLTAFTLEQLANLEVTSVSKKPEKQFHAPAAVYVITQEDIRRSGVTTFAEALRLAPGVEVARINSNQWSIGVRGFGTRLSRSVLVLMDGRAVYNPLFHGTYWELQDYVLADIDRIEVIRGPGGTLWGSNAVNGVINIISKHSKDTQGGRISMGGGTEEKAFGSVRYGGAIGKDATYRVYGKYFDRDASWHANGNDFDPWHMGHGGFRSDWNASSQDLVTVQGGLYRGRAGQSTGSPMGFSNLFGANLLSRWTRTFNEQSGMTLQLFYDHGQRHDPTIAVDHDTGDIDFQYRHPLPGRQDVTWGLGFRLTADETAGTGALFIDPAKETQETYSMFVQDAIALIPERLALTLGVKFENSHYSDWEIQPSARLQGSPTVNQSVWGAISRAVRTPSRLERDLSLGGVIRGRDFDSESVVAYEVGYRIDPLVWISFDAAGFYNDYSDLLSAEPGTPIQLSNGLEGETYGGELATNIQIANPFRIRAAYSFLDMDLRTKSTSGDVTNETLAEGSSPRHQLAFHALANITRNIDFDPVLRYVSALPSRNTPGYMEMDVRLPWRPHTQWELAVVGQNLIHAHHPEFGTVSELQRGVYGNVIWKW